MGECRDRQRNGAARHALARARCRARMAAERLDPSCGARSRHGSARGLRMREPIASRFATGRGRSTGRATVCINMIHVAPGMTPRSSPAPARSAGRGLPLRPSRRPAPHLGQQRALRREPARQRSLGRATQAVGGPPRTTVRIGRVIAECRRTISVLCDWAPACAGALSVQRATARNPQCFASPMRRSSVGSRRWLWAFQRITRYIVPATKPPNAKMIQSIDTSNRIMSE